MDGMEPGPLPTNPPRSDELPTIVEPPALPLSQNDTLWRRHLIGDELNPYIEEEEEEEEEVDSDADDEELDEES